MSDNISNNNKRIAKNTFMLYLRMLLLMGISLYTSRVVLQVLGVTDYGIYNLIAGLSSSFIFFSSSLSNATQRFLNFALGTDNISQARKIFNISLTIYLILILFVVAGIEIVGSWLIAHKLVIPPDRLEASYWILHTFTVSLCFTLIGTVFDSVLIARENMKLYAYLGLLDGIGKLAIVYMLTLFQYDVLILYSILMMVTTLLNRSIAIYYCMRKYPECKICPYWNNKIFKSMFGFVGWNGVGCAIWTVVEQGMNILLNIFFGPAINAAKAIANQVNNALNNFGTNFFVAVRPQIVKSYASNNYEYFINLILNSSRYGFYLLLLISLPVILRINYILALWLDTVPAYTANFVLWIFIYNLINILTNPFWSAVQAIGKLRNYTVTGGIVYLMVFPLSYIFLKLGYNPVAPFQILVGIRLLYLIVIIKIVRGYIDLPVSRYMKEVIYPILVTTFPITIIMYGINLLFPQNFISLIAVTLIHLFFAIIMIYLLGITPTERVMVRNKIKTYLPHKACI